MSQRTIYHPLAAMFSSPCLGIFFYITYYKAEIVLAVEFSSPCLGIFFYTSLR